MRRLLLFVMFVMVSCTSQTLVAQTVVTTYVTKVQEERRSTRFTLTEWLRIKERMKLMDVWLAMFSNPKEDTFRPELNLVYMQTRGSMDYDAVDETENDSGDLYGSQAKAQLFLTNIFTGSTGLRLLNIDFGIEGGVHQSNAYNPETTVSYTEERKHQQTYYTGNFRIFGKNIQDSSLILKVGEYQSRNSIPQLGGANEGGLRRGLVTGAELQLYLFRWMGLEGNYLNFGESDHDDLGWSSSGAYYDYMGYVEISLLRLMFGAFTDEHAFSNNDERVGTSNSGLLGGLKMQL